MWLNLFKFWLGKKKRMCISPIKLISTAENLMCAQDKPCQQHVPENNRKENEMDVKSPRALYQVTSTGTQVLTHKHLQSHETFKVTVKTSIILHNLSKISGCILLSRNPADSDILLVGSDCKQGIWINIYLCTTMSSLGHFIIFLAKGMNKWKE